MAASRETIERTLNVIELHMSREDALALLDDLVQVPGNQSFRVTLENLRFFLVARLERDARRNL